MYLYEFTIKFIDKDTPSYVTVEVNELPEQLAYCNKGKRDGWIESFTYEIIKEEWWWYIS